MSDKSWGISSNGRAPASHAGGTGINTRILQDQHFYNNGNNLLEFSFFFWACTKTRNTGTPEHRNTPEHPGTPEQSKKPGTPILTVLFCTPITDHVKSKISL